jgi:hypothetical protein
MGGVKNPMTYDDRNNHFLIIRVYLPGTENELRFVQFNLRRHSITTFGFTCGMLYSVDVPAVMLLPVYRLPAAVGYIE